MDVRTLSRAVTVGPHRNRVRFPQGTKLQSIAAHTYLAVGIPAAPEFEFKYLGSTLTVNDEVLVPTPQERRFVAYELVAGTEYL